MRICHEPLAREIGQPLPKFTTLNKVTLTYLTSPRLASPRHASPCLALRSERKTGLHNVTELSSATCATTDIVSLPFLRKMEQLVLYVKALRALNLSLLFAQGEIRVGHLKPSNAVKNGRINKIIGSISAAFSIRFFPEQWL